MRKNYAMRLAGRYTRKVTIESFEGHQDAFGQPIISWVHKADARAYIKQLNAHELYEDMAVYSKINYFIELRTAYPIKIYDMDRAVFYKASGDKIVLDIYSVEDQEENGRFLQIMGFQISPNEYTLAPDKYHLAQGDKSGTVGAGISPQNPNHTTAPAVTPHPPGIPKIITSNILDGKSNQIKVLFDMAMIPNLADGHKGISVILDHSHITPDSITWIDTKTMIIHLPVLVTVGQIVSWNYDDSIAGADLESTHHKELLNQTYAVTNKSALTAPEPPHLVHAVTKDKSNITVTFDKDMTMPAGYPGSIITQQQAISFKLTVDGVPLDDSLMRQTGLLWRSKRSFDFYLTASVHLTPANIIKLEYIGQTDPTKQVKAENGLELTKSVIHNVTNSLTVPGVPYHQAYTKLLKSFGFVKKPAFQFGWEYGSIFTQTPANVILGCYTIQDAFGQPLEQSAVDDIVLGGNRVIIIVKDIQTLTDFMGGTFTYTGAGGCALIGGHNGLKADPVQNILIPSVIE